MKNTINFATKAQAAMFKHEFLGQFSDGAWENSPGERWKGWSDVEIGVNDQNVGRNFESRYHNFDRYNLARKDLLEVVEERLLGIARVAQRWGVNAAGMLEGIVFGCEGWTGLPKHTGEYWVRMRSDIALWMQSEGISLDDVKAVVETTTYGPKQLRKDLKEMKLMMRMRCRDEQNCPKCGSRNTKGRLCSDCAHKAPKILDCPTETTATYKVGDKIQYSSPLFDEGYIIDIETRDNLTVLVLAATPEGEEVIELVLPRVVR